MSGFHISDALAKRLRAASRVCVLTGAGVSAESGLPTFRDALSGLWARFRPEELATPDAFRRDPELVWRWYAERRALANAARPNPAHCALAALERRVPEFLLATQNVDGLHFRAGSVKCVELHGSLLSARCVKENLSFVLTDEMLTPESLTDALPRCPNCGFLARPDVVWFGETLPLDALQAAFDAAASCDIFLCVGTSGLVAPAARLPALAPVVVTINPDTDFGPFSLRGPAGIVLPALVAAAWPEKAEAGERV